MNFIEMEKAERYTPGGVHSNTRRINPQLMPKSAKGGYFSATDGKKYLDFHAAFGPILIGHADARVNQKVIEALNDQDLFGVGSTQLEIDCSSKIVEHVPSAEKVLITNSGSESTFHAIRVSRAHTGRKKIIKFQGCYHGWHDYVAINMLSPKEKIGERDPGSAGMLDEVIDQTLICRFNDLDDVERTVHENKGEVAAIILEPIPHNIGCVLPKLEFLRGLRELCTQYGIVLIFDEVITGFRHGLGGYQEVCGVTPDLTTLGKAMANGYPIAALCGKSEIMEHFTTNPQGNTLFAGTYNGHVVGTAAVLATIEILENEPVYDHTFKLGETLKTGLQDIATRLGIPMNVMAFGSVVVPYFSNDLIENYESCVNTDVETDIRFRQGMIERGIFMVPMAIKRNHVMYEHTLEDIQFTLEQAEIVLKNMK